MAKFYVVCGSLFAYILIFLRITKVSSNNDYYVYQTEYPNHHLEYSISTELLQNQRPHTYHKRNVNIQPQTNISYGGTDTTESSTTFFSKSSVKLQKAMVPSTNLTNVILKDNGTNLGVNGSGQQQNVTAVKPILTTKTLMSSTRSPISSNDNATVAKNNQTNGDDSDISISKFQFPLDSNSTDFNKTLTDHNITVSRTDSHFYYNSTFKTDPKAGRHSWINMENRTDVKVNDLLSRSYRRAATVKLTFDFPFYGHLIKTVTIATGGFLYTGDYVHSWLAATQYIAPLMANFDPSLSNDSYIKYVDNGTAFTVLWEKVRLQDEPNEGEFTFQVTLHSNGDIVFVYQNVPIFIENIKDDFHPVKVGLSDAYIMDRIIFFVRRKTIYEYHRVNFLKEDIKNWTVIYLRALPTCLENKNCSTCLSKNLPGFQCMWCPSMNKCSNGLDRNRQEWLTKKCDKRNITKESVCAHITDSDLLDEGNSFNDDATYEHLPDPNKSSRIFNKSGFGVQEPVKMGVSGIVAILFLVAMVSGLCVWLLYAYRNPHTASGQILIRYRPSQWRWRRGEARYTAATIHM